MEKSHYLATIFHHNIWRQPMLNEKKIALMTKMAIYEQGEGKKSLPMSKYYRSDYISLRIINTTIVTTIAFFLIAALAVLVNVEKLLDELVSMDLMKIGKNILIVYIVVIIFDVAMTYIVYSYRFKKYRKGLNEYNGNLKKLYAINKQESRQARSQGGLEDEQPIED